MTSEAKAELRRAVRAAYPGKAQRDAESAALCANLLAWPTFQQAGCVAAYLPLPREADVTPLLLAVLAEGKTLALPRIDHAPHMTFRHVTSLDGLIPGTMGLMEPAEDAAVVPLEAIDLMIVPLEAIDHAGMRLGKGGGYYDKALTSLKGTSVAAVLSWQWTDKTPCEPWDAAVDAAADKDGIHVF